MKKAASLLILFFTLIVNKSIAQETFIFPKGEKAPNVHQVGTVWLNELSKLRQKRDWDHYRFWDETKSRPARKGHKIKLKAIS